MTHDGMTADMSGMARLEGLLHQTFDRLSAKEHGSTQQTEGATLADFDGWFAPLVRQELARALATVRHEVVEAATSAGFGATATAVGRRMYKDRMAGNVNILGNRKRISAATRPYPEATGGRSGIRRNRSVSARTKRLYGYAPVDRAFILRFLEYGTDVRTAPADGATGRGSRATYGSRGSLGARSFFGRADGAARQAAEQMGTTLVNYVEKWLEENMSEK